MSDTANVSYGKPKIGGAIFVAPFGTTLPTSASESLGSAFKGLGYISNDGLTNSNTISSESIKAWGGDRVLVLETDKIDDFKFKLIEILNVDVLKVVYGDSNVSGDLSTGITVRANSVPHTAHVYVVDMILAGNRIKRVVIPNAILSALEDIVYKDSEAAGYGATLSAMPGGESFGYDTHKEYIAGVTGSTGATGTT